MKEFDKLPTKDTQGKKPTFFGKTFLDIPKEDTYEPSDDVMAYFKQKEQTTAEHASKLINALTKIKPEEKTPSKKISRKTFFSNDVDGYKRTPKGISKIVYEPLFKRKTGYHQKNPDSTTLLNEQVKSFGWDDRDLSYMSEEHKKKVIHEKIQKSTEAKDEKNSLVASKLLENVSNWQDRKITITEDAEYVIFNFAFKDNAGGDKKMIPKSQPEKIEALKKYIEENKDKNPTNFFANPKGIQKKLNELGWKDEFILNFLDKEDIVQIIKAKRIFNEADREYFENKAKNPDTTLDAETVELEKQLAQLQQELQEIDAQEQQDLAEIEKQKQLINELEAQVEKEKIEAETPEDTK